MHTFLIEVLKLYNSFWIISKYKELNIKDKGFFTLQT